jgi:hypothetical protein
LVQSRPDPADEHGVDRTGVDETRRSGAADQRARWTIGVLSPLVHGYYFGGLLAGVVDVATRAGGRVLAIQTRDAGMRADPDEAAPFTAPVGWDHIDAFAPRAEAAREISAGSRPHHFLDLRKHAGRQPSNADL